MRIAFVYWLVGCLIVGNVMAFSVKRCPNNFWDTSLYSQALIGVAIWPAFLMAAYILKDTDLPAEPCKVRP